MVAGNATIEKPREQWDEEENKLVQYNLKPNNIITSALGMDEYFRVSNCKNAKGPSGKEAEVPEESEEVQALKAKLKRTRMVKEKLKTAVTRVRKECDELRDVNVTTIKELE